jgi:hypothetical protein
MELIYWNFLCVLTQMTQQSANQAGKTMSFPRMRESIGRALWHCVMGSRLRGNDNGGLSPHE